MNQPHSGTSAKQLIKKAPGSDTALTPGVLGIRTEPQKTFSHQTTEQLFRAQAHHPVMDSGERPDIPSGIEPFRAFKKVIPRRPLKQFFFFAHTKHLTQLLFHQERRTAYAHHRRNSKSA